MNRDRELTERMIGLARELADLAQQGKFRSDPIAVERVHLRSIFFAESADKLSPGFKSRYRSLWQLVRAFRTIVIHEYEAVDPEDLWQFIRDDLPRVVSTLKRAKFPKGEASH